MVKIWIVENRTDARIDEELMDAGVPKKDIAYGIRHNKTEKLELAAH
jgi:hypothetical protein